MSQPEANNAELDYLLGAQAERLMTDPVFRRAVSDLESQITETWKAATTLEAREQAHAEFTGLHSVVRQLRSYYDAAQLRQHREQQS